MEQKFLLLYHGKLSLIEQSYMSGEERAWWLKRTSDEIEKQNKAAERSTPGSG